jgi:hypothetical protein
MLCCWLVASGDVALVPISQGHGNVQHLFALGYERGSTVVLPDQQRLCRR